MEEKRVGRENVFASARQNFLRITQHKSQTGYAELPTSTLFWAGSAREGSIKVALTYSLLSFLKFSF